MEEKELLTLAEVKEQVKGTEIFSFSTKLGYAMITDSDDRCRKLFKLKGDLFEEVDVKAMVKMIAEYLARHIRLEKLLQDKLLHHPLETILQLKERVERKGEVKEHKGCYYLTIKGKQGPPLDLEL